MLLSLKEELVLFKRAQIQHMYGLCSQSERDGFIRFYPSVDDIPEYKLDIMYDLFVRTINSHKNAPQNTIEAGEQQATAQACQPQKDAASTH